MEEERPEDIVALDERAFILHYRTDAVRDLGIAIGLATVPVRREVGEETQRQSARIVTLVVAPPKQAPRHLQVLTALARLFMDERVLAQLLASANSAELVAQPAFALALPEQLTVRDLMTEQPRTTTADTPLREAAYQLLRGRLGALPVVDESSQFVGLLSERELLRDLLAHVALGTGQHKAVEHGPPPRRTVRDVMTRQVICVGPDQPLAEVASLMSNRDVERVPVVHGGQLVGFLTRGDIVRKLLGS